jgi:hypothetical protein
VLSEDTGGTAFSLAFLIKENILKKAKRGAGNIHKILCLFNQRY